MDPLHKPGLPKLYASPETTKIQPQINDEITPRLYIDVSLRQLKSLLYCGAIATDRLHGQIISFRVVGLSDRRNPTWKIHEQR